MESNIEPITYVDKVDKMIGYPTLLVDTGTGARLHGGKVVTNWSEGVRSMYAQYRVEFARHMIYYWSEICDAAAQSDFICNPFGYWDNGKIIVILYEHARGISLDRPKARELFMELSLLSQIDAICRLCDTVAAYNESMVHRDICPANILFDSEEVIFRLADLGVSLPVQSRNMGQVLNAPAGTWGYFPPEQLSASEFVLPGMDVYGLASTLLELLTERRGFLSSSRTCVSQNELLKILNGNNRFGFLFGAFYEALAINPEDRIQTASKFGQMIRAAYELHILS
ncbi:MAG: protein kinase [Patescibacteria group bacterium]|nr:protein kinase [Patescibacteria group bacterium]